MSLSSEYCVSLGRGLCQGLITRREESYRVWCVECDSEASTVRRLWPARCCCAGGGDINITCRSDLYGALRG